MVGAHASVAGDFVVRLGAAADADQDTTVLRQLLQEGVALVAPLLADDELLAFVDLEDGVLVDTPARHSGRSPLALLGDAIGQSRDPDTYQARHHAVGVGAVVPHDVVENSIEQAFGRLLVELRRRAVAHDTDLQDVEHPSPFTRLALCKPILM